VLIGNYRRVPMRRNRDFPTPPQGDRQTVPLPFYYSTINHQCDGQEYGLKGREVDARGGAGES